MWGRYLGQGCCYWALFTAVSISHWIDATTLELGRIGSGLPSTSGGSNCLERASDVEFLEPGWHEEGKVKVVKEEGPTSLT